ncbi:unnamed protein product [Penicillium salamii]|uniref:Uncharacterized protein n=1 Tax=Penicillium salamii TaxID=1612424 RepID=A0A9W4NZG2_9EURO|nr:unnamed protein product [Penicillium salamii]
MEATYIYSIVIAGIFILIILVNCLRALAFLGSYLKLKLRCHLTYPYILRRHRLLDPWSRAMFYLQLAYTNTNLVVLLIKGLSIISIRDRGGNLALINLIFPLSALHLSYIADVLNLSLYIARRLHRSMGLISATLLFIYIRALLLKQRADVSLIDSDDLLIVILYIYVTISIFGCTFILQFTTILYHNNILLYCGFPRAIITYKSTATIQNTSIKICLTLP